MRIPIMMRGRDLVTMVAVISSTGWGMAAEPMMKDLGTLGGTYSAASAINERGAVAGQSATTTGRFHAFLWMGGDMTDLGTLGSDDSYAVALNEYGEVLGNTQDNYYPSPYERYQIYHRAFLWKDGVMTDLGSLGGARSAAFALNERGQVVGRSQTALGEWHAFLWQKGVMTDLGTLGGNDSYAVALNERGEVVGTIGLLGSGFPTHAFLWKEGTMTDLGTLGGDDSSPFAINERGEVMGVSYTSLGASHAFLWKEGVMTDLGPFTGWPGGINDHEQVAIDVSSRAYLWERGILTDLGSLFDPVCDLLPGEGCFESIGCSESDQVVAINDRGQIVGNCWFADRTAHGKAHLFYKGSVTDLGSLGGNLTVATALDGAGDVVGFSKTSAGQLHAFLWANRTGALVR